MYILSHTEIHQKIVEDVLAGYASVEFLINPSVNTKLYRHRKKLLGISV